MYLIQVQVAECDDIDEEDVDDAESEWIGNN